MNKKNCESKLPIYVLGARFFSHPRRSWKESAGQSLIEIIVGLGIGALLIGAGAFTIAAMLHSNTTAEKYRAASGFSQELIGIAHSFAAAGWQNIYGLAKGSSTTYYLNASGTTFFVVNGQEGMLDNDVKSGLVGEWKFDEATTTTSTLTYDATGNNNNGTLTNGPARTTSTCKISNCINFSSSSSQYVNLGAGASLNITNNLTITAWVELANDLRQIIIGKGNGAIGFRTLLFIKEPDNSLSFTWTDDNLLPSSLVQTVAGSIDANWHHVVVTFTGGNVVLYIDGVSAKTGSGDSTIQGSAQTYVGYSSWTTAYPNGLIDDARIYNRTLSATEIKRLYNSGIYKRFFAVENVCRTNDASSAIAGTTPCSGTSEDASTEQITVHTQWTAGAGTGEAKMTSFLTRARNAVFQQTDWSGGSGASGAYTSAPTTYTSATNVSSTPGSIRILNLTQQ
ncbi:MAG: LamG domain-containing protein [Candidatus Jorgensenbacteria bacterium]